MNVVNFKTKKEIEADLDRQLNKNYFIERLNFFNACKNESFGIFKGCHSLLGPMPFEARNEILAYINNPTPEQWNRIFCIQITPSDSLLEAFKVVHPEVNDWIDGQRDFFNRNIIHWKKIPSAEGLIVGISKVVCDHEEYIKNKIKYFS